MLMTMFLSASICMQAMETVMDILPTAAMICVPLVSGVTMYNSLNADYERERWERNFAQRNENSKVGKFNFDRLNLTGPTCLAIVSFVCLTPQIVDSMMLEGRMREREPGTSNFVLGVALATSIVAAALQQYNRRQLDHAKKWASVDSQASQEIVTGSVENV